MWQNLGVSKQSRFFRKLLTSLIAAVLILGTMFVLAYQSDIDKRLNKKFPRSTCTDAAPSADVLQLAIDNYSQNGTPSGILYCHCKNIMFEMLAQTVKSVSKTISSASASNFANQTSIDNTLSDLKNKADVFNALNKVPGCKDFARNFVVSNSIVLVVPIVISILTSLAEEVLQAITGFERA
jgi:hypothetical protein